MLTLASRFALRPASRALLSTGLRSFSLSSALNIEDKDLVVIGGGPGGYVCAIKAAQLGLNVACVEKRGSLGGTCLNVGCIPSKALLHSSHLYEETKHDLGKYGINVGSVDVDLEKLMAQKEGAVKGLTGGIEHLFKKNKVEYVKGTATIEADKSISVAMLDGTSEKINAKNIVIATGSDVTPLPNVDIDEKQIVSSTGALSLPEIPKSMVVIGGGVIGLELGSVWRRLGAKVTVVEFLPHLLNGSDIGIAKEIAKYLKRQKMNLKLSTKVISATKTETGVKLQLEGVKDGKTSEMEADVVMVSIGRIPYTENLGLENINIETDKWGRIPVDHNLETPVPGIFAIGDVIEGAMLAHKAEEEGIKVAENLAGGHGHVNYDCIPSVVYTSPEVAWVGKTEEELKAEGVEYTVGSFPFMANSRAKAIDQPEGLVKVLAAKSNNRLLGAHIVNANAGEMIAEFGLALEYGASCEDIARTCHAHPTLSEAVKEACMDSYGKPIHM